MPAPATAAYLRATELPASIGPAIANAVFNAEYDVSTNFVRDTLSVSDAYLGVINTAGRVAYENTVDTIAIVNTFASLIASVPSNLEDAYLAALGKSALALEYFARVPKVAAVISATRAVTDPLLAAAAPAPQNLAARFTLGVPFLTGLNENDEVGFGSFDLLV